MTKRANKTEKAWLDRVANLGCCICGATAEIHHLLAGKGMGQKASNFDVIPLCDFHHRNGGHGFAIHSGVRTWEARHGTELYHLEKTRAVLL
jgi:hypothetical protein